MSAEDSEIKTGSEGEERLTEASSAVQPSQDVAGASTEQRSGAAGTSSGSEKKKGSTLPDLYDRFVSSFESAIDSIVGGSDLLVLMPDYFLLT